MSQALTCLEDRLTLPGCVLTKHGMRIDAGLSRDDLEAVGRALNAISGSGQWWWGDFLAHVEKHYGATYADAAEASGYEPGTLANCKWVCSNFESSSRDENLTFKHHYEALSECGGDAKKAKEWLTKASQAKPVWSVPEMRKQIRTANAAPSNEGPRTPQTSVYDFIGGIRRWVRTDLPTATPELRAQMKQDLEEIIAKL